MKAPPDQKGKEPEDLLLGSRSYLGKYNSSTLEMKKQYHLSTIFFLINNALALDLILMQLFE